MMLVNCKNDELYFENQKQSKKTEKTVKNDKKKKNAVKRANLLSRNEIQISEIITKIPRFFLNFGPILQYRDFKLAEIDDERFEKCQVMENAYFLFCYENREKMRDFWSFYNKSATKKQKILRIIQSFKNLLQITNKMSERKLAHMNLVPRNILFKEDETPYLINFDQTVLFEKEQGERKSNEEIENLLFSEYNPRKIHLPIEVHLLCYMNSKNLVSLSAANIETVVNDWVGGVSLSPLGKYITEEFKASAIFSRRGLINKPKYLIKQQLLSFASTWNNYSLSIIFLFLLSSLDDEIKNHKFAMGFITILLQNISGDGSKRENETKTLEKFDDFIYSISQEEWQQ
jgi:hypothetical protein